MEDDRCHDKQAEDDDLEEQPTKDYVLTQLHFVRVVGCHDPSTSALDEERKDIAAHEKFGEPGHPDDRQGFGVDHADETAERHVDACCEERRSHQDEQRLYDERDEGLGAAVTDSAANVSNEFDCMARSKSVNYSARGR